MRYRLLISHILLGVETAVHTFSSTVKNEHRKIVFHAHVKLIEAR